jgi:hypothetical protein
MLNSLHPWQGEKETKNMRVSNLTLCLCFGIILALVSCPTPSKEKVELKHFPIDSMEGILTRSGVRVDRDISSDGNGSLRATSTGPRVFRLFETGDVDVENARLVYRARLRTENVEGHVYLEMWCHFPGKGEFFSRGIQTPLTGTTEWTTEETPFFLKKGENPDNVKLNLVMNGKGRAWIDDIHLLKAPLK